MNKGKKSTYFCKKWQKEYCIKAGFSLLYSTHEAMYGQRGIFQWVKVSDFSSFKKVFLL
jgi:hypothetical protein